ncbi:MAG: hypothetical protein DMF85_08560 [Acidobacteria bacterium]|nr:MAG: hypothetical protein DMF85_08560 [Acidobacteriota bacterium]
MRHSNRIILASALAACFSAALVGQPPDAKQILSGAREALGGEKKLAEVRTFVATGRTRQLRGNNLVPIEFEIDCELPDKFVRKDDFPAQDTDPTTLGFNGETLIQVPPPPPAPPAASAQGPGRGGGRGGGPPRVIAVKQDFARLTLGMFAASFAGYPVTFKYAAQAEAPEGKADVLDVSGPANFAARFLVQRDTHLPVMLMWQTPVTNVVMKIPGQPAAGPVPPGAVVVDAPAPPAGSAGQAERDQYAAAIANLRRQTLSQAKPIENRIYYADYRNVDGLKLPFRIRRAVAGETIEETTFDQIRINAKIDPRKFEVSK